MSTPSTPVGKFRKVLQKFLEELKTWGTPEQLKELSKYEYRIDIGMKVDAKGSVGLFIESIEPYAAHIMQGDDDYFMNGNLDVDSEYMKLQSQLREWWPNLDHDKRDIVRNKLKLLLMLGTIAVQHENLRQLINNYRDPTNPLKF